MGANKKKRSLHIGTMALLVALVSQAGCAGPLREHLTEHQNARMQQDTIENEQKPGFVSTLPAGIRILRDVAYGADGKQRFDVYAPPHAHNAPVIFMVHGGAWRIGDKAMQAVVQNKVARWVPRGFIFVSTNYRLVPAADPIEQARDVARALATAQEKAAAWGGDRNKFILMGHSAGAHLVALLTASPEFTATLPVTRWLGSVLLDSAALDVVQLMQDRHPRLYDRAFGRDPQYWNAASPYHVLMSPSAPMLAVCSTQRANSCSRADAFVAKASSLGSRASVLRQDLTHKGINLRLGEEGAYTREVEAFMRTLDETAAGLLR